MNRNVISACITLLVSFLLFPGNLFAHEWAKLRYGVFEEYGFPGDENYPCFYLDSEFTQEGYVTVEKPNYCTDQEIVGHQEYEVRVQLKIVRH